MASGLSTAALAAMQSFMEENGAAVVAELVDSTVDDTDGSSTAGERSERREDREASEAAKRVKYSYNPNRARDGERRELLELRGQVVELTQELDVLREVHRSCPQRHDRKRKAEDSAIRHDHVQLTQDQARAAQVWKEIADNQFQLHTQAVRENQRLRRVVEGHNEIANGLQRLLQHRNVAQVCSASIRSAASVCLVLCIVLQPSKLFEGETRVYPMMAVAPDAQDAPLFQELLAGLDGLYQEVDDIFRGSGLKETDAANGDMQMHEDASGNLFAEIFANKIFPFDVSTTGFAAWKVFSFCVRPNCTSFFSQMGAEVSSICASVLDGCISLKLGLFVPWRALKNVESSDNTVAESFGIEFRMNNMTAIFRGRQIKRCYIEEDRVVIVWQAFMNPIEFDGRPISGAEFRERGYFIIRKPTGVAEEATFSLLQTCYVLTPNVPVRTLPEDSVAGALTNFVLTCMTASVPVNHQIIENMLFDMSLTQQTGCR